MRYKQFTSQDLLIRPAGRIDDPNLILDITPEQVGWQYLTFQVRWMDVGEIWTGQSGENEMILIPLSGFLDVTSTRDAWTGIGRASVFSSAAHVLYLPRRTDFRVNARIESEMVLAYSPTDADHAPFLIEPSQVQTYLKGSANLSRQVNDLLPPAAPAHRLMSVEVYTPGGNWSSYPPHKHELHREDESGNLLEADLEEIYLYQFDNPAGYAYQRIYTDQHSALEQAGYPFDCIVRPEHNHAVIIPGGYHPVVGAPDCMTYFLCILAGSARSLASYEDPRYTMQKPILGVIDPRLPLY